jgi:outer membrane protein OmpA-like peptidoglycan-associated protein
MTQRYRNTTDLVTPSQVRQPGTVEQSVVSKLDYWNITPLIRIRPFYFPVYFLIGPTLLFPAGPTFNYTETTVGGGLVFSSNQKSSRSSGITDVGGTSTTLAVTGGVGLEIPFSERQGLMVELQASPMLNDISDRLQPEDHWKAMAVSGILAFRYGFGGTPPPPPPPPPKLVVAVDTVRQTTPREPQGAGSDFDAAVISPEGSRDTMTITGDAVRATEVHALLPYIFFEQDSSVIPARYAQVDKRGIRSFDLARIPRGSTLGVYYEMMNIIGKRLRDNRKASITVTGCVSQFEGGDTALSRRRAVAIANYLQSTWAIAPNRMKIVVRDLPENPSLSEVDTLEGSRENQRVEIAASDYAILAPVMLPDTVYLRPAGTIRFTPPAVDSLRTNDWTLDLQIGDSIIKNAAKGYGPPNKPIDVSIANRPDLNFPSPVQAFGIMRLQDTLFETFSTLRSKPIIIRQTGKFEEQRKIVGNNYRDEYNLLLFSFDSAGVFDFSQQATAIMQERITPDSKVRVFGHTDRIGLPPYNKALSQRRAETAASLLGVTPAEVVGLGEKQLLYDNKFPEGRYYSRSVTVVIETPVDGSKQAKLNKKGGESQ